MKPHWLREHEALDRLGFSGINGSPDRQRAAEVVAELMREIESLRKTRQSADGNAWCATGAGFINLQESHAGFGDSPRDAVAELRQATDTKEGRSNG